MKPSSKTTTKTMTYLASLMLCVAGCGTTAWAGGRPASAETKESKRLAVLEIKGDDVSTKTRSYLSRKLRAEALAHMAPGWQVMTRDNMQVLIDASKNECLQDGSCEVETLRNLGADRGVTAEVVKIGGELRLTMNLYNSHSGELVRAMEVVASDEAGLASKLSSSCKQLFVSLDLQVAVHAPEPQRPRVDVVFALDTTGSMAGLIAGAKAKIWSIANRIVSGQPRPKVRLGLVGYRDRGDAYVTKMMPLSEDIDAVHEALVGFQAAGGGDGPEHVNQALVDSIRKMEWDRGQKTLRLIFLVGDAPPHDDYQDGLNSRALAKEARQNGIVINTIRCGRNRATEQVWQALASLGDGRYASIAQNGGVVAVATPFDHELRKLNGALADTMVSFGGSASRAKLDRRKRARKGLAPSAAAEAASYSAKAGRMATGDLLTAVEDGEVAVEAMEEENLPTEMKGMSSKERMGFIRAKKAERGEVQARILQISKKREAWLESAKKKSGAKVGFDGEVVEMLKEQAASVGVAY